MNITTAMLTLGIVFAMLTTTTTTRADSPPRWAYPENNPGYKPPVDDGSLVRVPDSTAGYTWSQLRDRFIAPVWHPNDHGPLPDIVAHGRKPDVFACGFCHRADGPEVRKTPTWLAFPRATSFNKSPTIKAVRAVLPLPAARRQA